MLCYPFTLTDEVKKSTKILLTSAQSVAPVCDGRTSRATKLYVTIISQHISEEWELVSPDLQTRSLHKIQTGRSIARLPKSELGERGTKGKDPATGSDNK